MKKIIYFPSFSVGNPYQSLSKNLKFKDGKSGRFYNNSSGLGEEFVYPYFLLTAGHYYKQANFKEKFGFDDNVLLMGDSGGYQIATKQLKYSPALMEQIFHWLENNSALAINLDIPPWKGTHEFNECLDLSYNNFKYFYENQSGKTQFLNVLHGYDSESSLKWYNKVKGFEFNGWSCGGSSGVMHRLLENIAILLQNKEHLKPNNHYLHILGTSRLLDLFVLIVLQKEFVKHGINIQVTTDSSSPSIAGAFGGWYHSFSISNLTFKNISLSNKFNYEKDTQIPISCSFDKKILLPNINFQDIIKYDTMGYYIVILHNLYVVIEAIEQLHYLIYSDEVIQKQVFTNNIMQLSNIVKGMIESSNPMEYIKKYKFLINDISNKQINVLENNNIEKFFTF